MFQKSLSKIESVQRRTCKYVICDYNMGYKDRLTKLDLLPLSLRRIYLGFVFLYNCLNDIADFDIESVIIFDQNNDKTRNNGDKLTLSVPGCNLVIYEKFFTHRVVKLWNLLPYDIRSCELTDAGYNRRFKRELKAWLKIYF